MCLSRQELSQCDNRWQQMSHLGQTRLSSCVGFTPDFGRMVATQRTDASGQLRTNAPQQEAALLNYFVGEREQFIGNR